MLLLIVGLAVFFAVHLMPTSPDLRRGLVERFGEGGYKAIFAVLSLAGFALIVIGFHKLQLHPEKAVPLWTPPDWTRHVAYLLMLPAMILLAAAYIPSRIRTAAKHPMLAAVKLWALAHLLAAGRSVGALVLFGAFLAYGIYDRISVKARGAQGPLGAREGSTGGDITAVAVGLALYAFMLVMGHQMLIGVPISSFSFAP